MKELVMYLLQVNLGIVLFYLVYRILLNKNTTFLVKRWYLLVSLILVFILPFIKFTQSATVVLSPINELFDFQDDGQLSKIQFLPNTGSIKYSDHFNFFSISLYIYLFISILYLFKVIFDLLKLRKSINRNEKISKQKINFVINERFLNPFSFFNFIFTKSVGEIENKPEYIHELAHVKQLHSIDRLLVELSIPVFWVNPFIYLIRKSMVEVHEHLADSEVIRNGVDAVDYQRYLYLQLKSGQYLKMTSNFNYSLTKKRITMISNKISMKKSIVRTVFSVVLVATIFVFYGFNNHRIIDPVVGVQLNHASQINSDTVPTILPLKQGGNYYIGSSYGMRKHPITGKMKMHNGIDIVADKGTEIIAPADGEVIEAKWKDEYGNLILIKHSETLITLYAHLSGFRVKAGDKVKTGDVIGLVGSTGLATCSHLHYEVYRIDRSGGNWYQNPADYIKNIKEIPRAK